MEIENIYKVAKDNDIPENLFRIIVEKCFVKTFENIYGKENEYLIDLKNNSFKIISDSDVRKLEFKDSYRKGFAFYFKLYFANFLNEVKPEKFKDKFDIDEKIKAYKELDRMESKPERDPYENFRFGGLSGEEAHTAYWNCD